MMTTAKTTTGAPAADLSLYPKPYRDPALICELVHSGYQHLWGGYLALARHFEATGDTRQAAIYREKYDRTAAFELDLWKLSDDEQQRHDAEVLPPLIEELHALQKQFLGR